MDSKRLTAEALRGIKAAAEGNTTDTPMAFRSMLRSLLADRAALEKRVGELEAHVKSLEDDEADCNAIHAFGKLLMQAGGLPVGCAYGGGNEGEIGVEWRTDDCCVYLRINGKEGGRSYIYHRTPEGHDTVFDVTPEILLKCLEPIRPAAKALADGEDK